METKDKHKLRRLFTLVTLATLASTGVQHAKADNIDLDAITVVSAAGFEQKLTDAPASITVIDQQALEQKPYAGIADALRDIEGIDVGSGVDKNGNINITMRGLPAEYTLILINGRRQSDIGNIGPNNFGNSQFMYMPPLDTIERIEVIRGPMSTLYGADAMGGVINIITKKVSNKWGGSLTQSLTLHESSQFGDHKKTEFSASGPLIPGKLGLGLRGNIFDREQSDPGYVSHLPLPEFDIDGNANDPFYEDGGSFGDRKTVAARNYHLGATLNFTPVENHDISLEFDAQHQRYDNTQGQTGTLDSVESLWRARNGIIQPRVGYTPYQRTERQQFVLAHEGRWQIGSLQSSLTRSKSANYGRSLPLTIEERESLQALWDANNGNLTDAVRAQLESEFLPRKRRTLEITNTIFDTQFNTAIQDHFLTIGAQYYRADMEDGVFGMDGAGYRQGTKQKHEQTALFIEDNWDIVDSLTLTLGGRYDHHNIYSSQFSPRGYLTWRTNDFWTVKGGVSTGYKTPQPNQLFEGIVNFGGQGVNPMVGNPDLKPETSVNYEVGVYYDSLDRLNVNATFFKNDFKDKIASGNYSPNCYDANSNLDPNVQGNCVDIGPGWAELGYTEFSQTLNVDKAETRGVELAGSYDILHNLNLRTNYTYTKSEQKSGKDKGLPLVNTPKHMANATLTYRPIPKLGLSFITEVRDKRYRGTAAASGPQQVSKKLYYKSYELYHLGAHYEVNQDFTLHARVNNLFDKDYSTRTCTLNAQQDGYDCASDYNVVEQGRSLWLSANYRF